MDNIDKRIERALFPALDGSGVHPLFSTDIAAAWMVVEKMRELGWNMELSVFQAGPRCSFFRYEGGFLSQSIVIDAETAPLAICRAVLRATKEEQA